MKRLVFYILYVFGIVRLAAWLNRRRVMILCYHGVTERPERNPQEASGLHVRQDRFTQHLEYLKRRYCVLSLSEYLEKRQHGMPLPPYSVVLTFDDGYRNFFSAAAPRLLAAEMTACMFLITDRIAEGNSKDRRWSEIDDEVYLSWTEIEELKSHGFEFGSHTCSHPKLPELSDAEILRELTESKVELMRWFDAEPLPLAYPSGLINDRVISQSRAVGYVCGLTTEAGFNDEKTDLFEMRRTLIGDDDDIPSFAARVAGLTRWLSPIRRYKDRFVCGLFSC